VLQSNIDLVQFDTAVNMGPVRAVKMLHQAVGVGVDGNFGQETRGIG
jgi:lysozyme family protein